MPKVAQKPPAPLRKRMVRHAGKQEQFADAARELAEKLGFSGADDLETEQGLSVRDARRYIVKTLHEHYQAGARGEAQPDYKAACEHLCVDNAGEQAAIDAALGKAFEDGKGKPVESSAAKRATMGGQIEGSAAKALGALGVKAKEG